MATLFPDDVFLVRASPSDNPVRAYLLALIDSAVQARGTDADAGPSPVLPATISSFAAAWNTGWTDRQRLHAMASAGVTRDDLPSDRAHAIAALSKLGYQRADAAFDLL